MKSFLFLLLSILVFNANAQTPKTENPKALNFCEAITKMKDAAETNFIGFTSTDYVEGKSDYTAKWPLPGFDKNDVAINSLIKMYYTSGLKYFKTLDEAKGAFTNVKASMTECFANSGTDGKTEKRPELNKWTSDHKDFMNNAYKVETTLAVFQNTKTGDWALEYFMMRK